MVGIIWVVMVVVMVVRFVVCRLRCFIWGYVICRRVELSLCGWLFLLLIFFLCRILV